MKASSYVNPIGGLDLYDPEKFKRRGIALKFLRPKLSSYRQFDEPFVERLSIIDVLMFNSKDEIKSLVLGNYELIS